MQLGAQKSIRPAKNSFFRQFQRQLPLQLMVLLGMGFILVFRFFPIYGLQLAFKELVPGKGIWDARFVGLKHYEDFFLSGNAAKVLGNTLGLSLLKIVFGFPMPIVFALLLNEIRSYRARSLIQGISYLPHFLSWVVIMGVVSGILQREGGVLNNLLLALGVVEEPIHFLGTPDLFWPIMIVMDIWKGTGWSAIIYMASISSIDPQLYEAARVDGAGRFRQTISITLPAIMPTVVIMLILRVGSVLDAGFDQLLVFRNSITHDKASILDVYVYDVGTAQGRYGYATAVGLFKSVVGLVMISSANMIARRFEMGLW